MKKQYTKQQIHNAIKSVFPQTEFEERKDIEDVDHLVYKMIGYDLKIIVSLESGLFSGYVQNENKIVPPHGSILSIRGM